VTPSLGSILILRTKCTQKLLKIDALSFERSNKYPICAALSS